MIAAVADQTGFDAQALMWLDKLMDLARPEREAELRQLAKAQPALHARVRRMLDACDAPEAPVVMPMPDVAWSDPREISFGLRAGASLGGYRLLREIGRGGMSVVWLAERMDGVLKRAVALKMPRFTLTAAADIERFSRERDVLASLSHPQIAKLFDAGVDASGQPFIVLEYIDGQPITTACAQGELDLRQRLELFLQVLAAVGHAHKHLVVHRDIKPSNILVDAQGQARLLDFGVAKLLDDSSPASARAALTQEAGCAVTPQYAAPEQLRNGPVSTVTDIYALGVVLFELVSGASPYGDPDASVAQWVHAVLDVQPTAPSKVAHAGRAHGSARVGEWSSRIDADLDTIILKALRKDPAERYSSIERFADDIQCYLGHRPIQARPPTWRRRARLLIQRHRGASLAGLAGLLVATVLSAAAWQQHLETVQQRERADAVRDFMFDLVDDAEADEKHPGSEVTGRQMVNGAVKRARETFADQPRLRGELLGELGRMQERLGDPAASSSLLQESLALLEMNAPDGDPALNKVRAHMAAATLDAGQGRRAQSLAELVLRQCASGADCAKPRWFADTVLRDIALQAGQTDVALRWMRTGVNDCRAAYGAHHAETVMALHAMAMVARQAGQLTEARRTLEQAFELGQGVTLSLTDRMQMRILQAVLDFDLGDYTRAGDRLHSLQAVQASAEDQAYLWRLLANVELAQGQAQAALDAAIKARSLASGASAAVEGALALQAQARAMTLSGSGSAAIVTYQGAIAGLREAGYSDQSMEVLRARRMLAEAQMRMGQYELAMRQLEDVSAAQQRSGVGQAMELAQTLDLIGCAWRNMGHVQDALRWHAKAAAILRSSLPDDHPLRARNQVYQALSSWLAKPSLQSRTEFAQLASTYARRFPATSVWRMAIDRAMRAPSCTSASADGCALIL